MINPTFSKRINFNSLRLFLKNGWIATPHTIFESTFKLKPGHYLEIDLANKSKKELCYWDVHSYYRKKELSVSFLEAKETVLDLLKSACEYRMVADTKVGIFLSGGIDSSTVAAILQANRQQKINTFSIGFDNERYNEAPYARAVAEHLGTEHHEITCTVNDALDLIPDLPYYYDEPFADSSAIPTMLVSKLASSRVKVALSADGGDEIFGGYPRYYEKMNELLMVQSIPDVFKQPLSGLINIPMVLSRRKNPHYYVRLEKLKKALNCSSEIYMYRYRSEPYHFSENEISKLLRNGDNDSDVKTYYDDVKVRHLIDPSSFMMSLEYKTTLMDDLLVKVDRATMAYSLEGREPLLDHRLVEYCALLGRDIQFKGGKTKSLLREICYEYIPKELIDRPKRGFSIPTNLWLHRELKDIVLKMTSQEYINKQQIFCDKQVKRMIDNYYSGYDKNGERIWIFLMFQLWYDRWMN